MAFLISTRKLKVLFGLLTFLVCTSIQAAISVQSDRGSTVISVHLEDLNIDTLSTEPFIVRIQFKNNSFHSSPNEPAIPFRYMSIASPIQANSSASIQPQQVITLNNARLIGIDGKAHDQFPLTVYGDSIVKKIGTDKIFGIKTHEFIIYPVRYDAKNNRITILTDFTIRFPSETLRSIELPRPVSNRQQQLLMRRLVDFNTIAKRLAVSPSRNGFNKKKSFTGYNTGPWLKIKIDHDGLYKIRHSDIKDVLGSAVSFAEVHLHGFNGRQLEVATTGYIPLNPVEQPYKIYDFNQNGQWDSSDYILFFGSAANTYRYNSGSHQWYYVENPYDFFNYYFLGLSPDSHENLQLKSYSDLSPSATLTQADFAFHYEKSNQNFLESGTEWYDFRMSGTSEQRTFSFTLPVLPAENTDVRLNTAFKGGSGSLYSEGSGYYYSISMYINGTVALSNRTFSNFSNVNFNQTLAASIFKNSNEAQIVYAANLSNCYAYFDYLDLQYSIDLTLNSSTLQFFAPGTSGIYQYSIANLINSNEVVVFKISGERSVVELATTFSDNTILFRDSLTTDNGVSYLIGNVASAEIPAEIKTIQYDDNLHDTANSAEFLIVTSKEMQTGAEKIKQLKENPDIPEQHLKTKVVTMDQIYDEFSSGQVSPIALRNFIKYAVENWYQAPSYVLLLGDGHYDYRNIVQKTPNHVPTMQVEHPYEIKSREVDVFFTDLNIQSGSFNLVRPDIPIGRISVESEMQAEIVHDKLLKYIESYLYSDNFNGWQLRATMVADDERGNFSNLIEKMHLEDSEYLIKNNYIPPNFNIRKIYLSDYPLAPGGIGRYKPEANNALIDAYNRGTNIINYFGHGSPSSWAHESVFNLDRDLPRLANAYRNPFIIAATCDFGLFDMPDRVSACEALIRSEAFGAIGILSATRPTYATPNRDLVRNFLEATFHSYPGQFEPSTVGDALIATFATRGGENDQKYFIMGDPTLRLNTGHYQVKLDTTLLDTLKALSRQQIKGTIIDNSGNTLTGFNGTAVVTVFDAKSDKIINELKSDLSTDTVSFYYPGNAIFRGRYSITNGLFNGEFIVPKSIRYKNDPSGKISIYAWSDSDGAASGHVSNLLVYGSEKNIEDSKGPQLSISFKENPSFIDGDVLAANPTILISITDSSGINITGETGHEILLILDDKQKFDVTDYFLYKENSFQEGTIEYPFTGLATGRHSLKIKVWDNLNNVSEDVTDFEVINTQYGSDSFLLNHVVNAPNPMSNDTWFTFSLINSSSYAEATIKIYTLTGRLIRKLITPLPNPSGFQKIYWDGRDEDGDRLANGVYIYKITVDNGKKKISQKDKLMIVK